MIYRKKERENNPIVLWNRTLIEGARAWQVLLKIYRFILALLNYLRGAFNLDLINIKVNHQWEGPHRIKGRCSICARENADDMIRLIDSRWNEQISTALSYVPIWGASSSDQEKLWDGYTLGGSKETLFLSKGHTLGHAWLYAVDSKWRIKGCKKWCHYFNTQMRELKCQYVNLHIEYVFHILYN